MNLPATGAGSWIPMSSPNCQWGVLMGQLRGDFFFFNLGKVDGFWLQKRKKTLTPTV